MLQAEEAGERVRVLLQDKLLARGKVCNLYLPVASTTVGVVACTCTKNTTDTADRACLTCFGTQFAPGYLKFLYDTQFWCSAEAASFVLTTAFISASKKANVIVLDEGALTGTIETQDKAFTNLTPAADYELKLEAYRRAAGETFTLEFSTDAGAVWDPVALTEVSSGFGFTGTLTPPAGAGNIRFRLTMTRVSVDDLTPAFEIIRLRRVLSEYTNQQIVRRRPGFGDGNILVLRGWTQEQDSLDPSRGRLTDNLGSQAWTSPLDFFSTFLTRDTPTCKINDALGPHAFYTYTSGVQGGDRYAISQVNFNEWLGVFTHQYLQDRHVQEREPIQSVW